MKNFVLLEANNMAQSTLLFKEEDEAKVIERWSQYYRDEEFNTDEDEDKKNLSIYKNTEGYVTNDEVHIYVEDLNECTDAEMEVLSKFCTIMY